MVYKVVNKINGNIYIGQTVGKFKKREAEHLNNAKAGRYDNYFYRAIRKYGKDNFTWEIIDKCSTPENLNGKEEYWIKELNSLVPNGYNLQSGGNNYLAHEETKTKMRENHADFRGENGPMYGKNHTEEACKKMRGRKCTEETLKKMSGENSSRAKLKEADISDIREMRKSGMKLKDIAKIKNICFQNVSNIVNYKRWKHIEEGGKKGEK